MREFWLYVFSDYNCTGYIDHTLTLEAKFKKFDRFIEQIEEDLVNEQNNVDLEEEDAFNWYSSVFLHFFGYFLSKTMFTG
jgi:hypothetical protein